MTPKAKAYEMVDKYYQLMPMVKDVILKKANIEWEFNDWEQAKKCALISVAEILNIQWVHSEPTCFDDLVNEYKSKSDFWNQVKEEIIKL